MENQRQETPPLLQDLKVTIQNSSLVFPNQETERKSIFLSDYKNSKGYLVCGTGCLLFPISKIVLQLLRSFQNLQASSVLDDFIFQAREWEALLAERQSNFISAGESLIMSKKHPVSAQGCLLCPHGIRHQSRGARDS
ncbi:hypothetical protein D5086_016064 [Populus alba]|uniref:Uncharacterized protein n=1 Tax=Populus alba TaxID=43335 RepID=A0ACC4BTJ5_POPAL